MVAALGLTAIEAKLGGVAVKPAVPVTFPRTAVIVAFPCARAVATPLLSIVALFAFDELHVTELVRSLVVPSVYLPLARNCAVVPEAAETLGGATEIERRLGGAIVRLAVPVTPAEMAVTVTVPSALLVNKPLLLIVAVAVLEVCQVAERVKSPVLPSLYFPVAMNWSLKPAGTEELADVTWIDCNTRGEPGCELPPPPHAESRESTAKIEQGLRNLMSGGPWADGVVAGGLESASTAVITTCTLIRVHSTSAWLPMGHGRVLLGPRGRGVSVAPLANR